MPEEKKMTGKETFYFVHDLLFPFFFFNICLVQYKQGADSLLFIYCTRWGLQLREDTNRCLHCFAFCQ